MNMLLFFFMVFFGVFISLSSDNWFGLWFGMEMNVMGFIFFTFIGGDMMVVESSVSYYVLNVLSSMVFLYFLFFSGSMFFFDYMGSVMVILAMTVSLGVPPFYFWYPNISLGYGYWSLYILMTVQSIIPLVIVSVFYEEMMMIFMVILSSLVGGIGGLGQVFLKKILVYSSISHMAWVFMCMVYSDSFWGFYFFIYVMMLFPIVFYLEKMKFVGLFSEEMSGGWGGILVVVFLLSLGGFPPMLGFYPKCLLLMMTFVSGKYLFVLVSFLIFSSLLSLYYYIRIGYVVYLGGGSVSWGMSNTDYLGLGFFLLGHFMFFLFF